MGGVLITLRDRLQFHPVDTTTASVRKCFALSKDRQPFKAEKHLNGDRRVKPFMKQVVGSPFWRLGEDDHVAEAEIISDVAKASLTYAGDPMKSPQWNERNKFKTRKTILKKLQALLHGRVKINIETIVNKLFDKGLPLGWLYSLFIFYPKVYFPFINYILSFVKYANWI